MCLWIFCAEAVCPEFRLSVLRSCSQNNPVTSKNVAGQKKNLLFSEHRALKTCPSINSFHSPTCEYLNLEFQSGSSTVLYPWVSLRQVKQKHHPDYSFAKFSCLNLDIREWIASLLNQGLNTSQSFDKHKFQQRLLVQNDGVGMFDTFISQM